jgi:phenylacetate-CoA ligase
MEMRTPSLPAWCREASWDWKHYLERLYRFVPGWAQNLGITLYGISYRRERLGGVFNKYVEEFRARDRWPDERMRTFLEERLRAVLAHAFREVPYYRQRWRAAGLESKRVG